MNISTLSPVLQLRLVVVVVHPLPQPHPGHTCSIFDFPCLLPFLRSPRPPSSPVFSSPSLLCAVPSAGDRCFCAAPRAPNAWEITNARCWWGRVRKHKRCSTCHAQQRSHAAHHHVITAIGNYDASVLHLYPVPVMSVCLFYRHFLRRHDSRPLPP